MTSKNPRCRFFKFPTQKNTVEVLLQCSVPEDYLHCQCILSIFTASMHQFYVKILLVFVNINPVFSISTTNLHWMILLTCSIFIQFFFQPKRIGFSRDMWSINDRYPLDHCAESATPARRHITR